MHGSARYTSDLLMSSLLTRLRRAARKRAAHEWGLAWPLRSRFIAAGERNEAVSFLERRQEQMVFVLGAGRSGTQWLCDLLRSAVSPAIYHEPNFREDVATMDTLRRDPSLAQRYWREYRAVEVYRRWRAQPHASHYGEVNGTIRYQAPAIRALYPRAQSFLLARDGRSFVRSVMGYPEFYGTSPYPAYALEPLPGDRLHDEWPALDRFERVCWAWKDTYEFLIASSPPRQWLLLERLVSDYDYFQSRLSAAIGVAISPDTWRGGSARRSRNCTAEYAFPAWEDWGRERQAAFGRICGDTMSRLGYAL